MSFYVCLKFSGKHILFGFCIYCTMMNYVWTAIAVISFLLAIINNRTSELTKGILDGAQNTVNICLHLLGILTLWNGMGEIISVSGLDKKTEKIMSFFTKRIFPTYRNSSANSAICANITANLLGLGNAATPLGIEAMKRMKEYSGNSYADNETVRFVVINSAALTLIPTNIAALRTAAGSEAPFSILIPVWLSGITALAAGLIAEKILSKRWKL